MSVDRSTLTVIDVANRRPVLLAAVAALAAVAVGVIALDGVFLEGPSPHDGRRRIERRTTIAATPDAAPVLRAESSRVPAPRAQRVASFAPSADPAPCSQLAAASLPPSVLHVVDADTGAPLAGVQVALGTPAGATVGGPGWRALEGSTASPIALDRLDLLPGRSPWEVVDPARGALRFWVSAPGFAWTDVVVDLAAGGTSEVALERGASVRLDVSGAPAGQRLRLVPRGDGARVAHERTHLVDGLLEIGGVAPGRYELRVEARRAPHALAHALDLSVPPGGVRTAVALEARPDPVRVTLRGEVRIAEGWGAPRGRLVVRRTGTIRALLRTPLAELEQPDGTFAFDAGEVAPGAYEVVLDGYAHRGEVRVDPRSDGAPVLVTVAPPAALEVVLVSSADRTQIPDAHLRWRAAASDAPFGRRGVTRREDGAFALTVPAGTIALEVTDSDGTLRASRELTVAAGEQRVELSLEPAGAIEVSLRDEWGAVAWDRLRCRAIATSLDTGERRVVATPRLSGLVPGRYGLRVEAGDRFEPVDLGTVRVDGGMARSVDARLVTCTR